MRTCSCRTAGRRRASAQRLGVPVLATAHRADVLDVPARGGSQRTQVEQAVAWVDQVVAVSHAMRGACEALATPKRPVAVVPNGADTRVFFPRDRAETRRRLGLPHDERDRRLRGRARPRARGSTRSSRRWGSSPATRRARRS